jgi:diacylglycerol kinase (ATP)
MADRPHTRTNFFGSFRNAFYGIGVAAKSERNFRVHLVATVIALALSLSLRVSTLSFAVVVLCIALVISVETINTAIERLCDLVDASYNPKVKVIKDLSAGATLMAALGAAIAGAVIFIPAIIRQA